MDFQGDEEWSLLVSCCLLDGEELDARVEEALGRPGFRVPHFVALARHHKLHLLIGRVFARIKHGGLAPDDLEVVRRLLPEMYRLHRFRSDLVTRAAIELCARVGRDAPVAVTKGVAIQHTVYAGDGTRYFGDLDIMIRDTDTETVSAVLDELGYVTQDFDYARGQLIPTRVGLRVAMGMSKDHLHKRVRPTGEPAVPVVELDTAFSLTWGDAEWSVPMAEVLSRTASVATPQGSFSTLVPPYQFLFLLLHLFREAWFEPRQNALVSKSKSVRLAQFRDVVRAWRSMTAEEQQAVRDLTVVHGIEPPIAWVATHNDRVMGTDILGGLGFAAPDEQWLSSAADARRDAKSSSVRWAGSMTTRLQDRRITVDEPSKVRPDQLRIGVSLAPPDIQDVPAYAEWAERIGVDTLSFGEGRLRRDAVVPMTLAAARTSRVRLSSGVIPARTRNVSLLATTFKTLHQLAPGRVSLGIGAWWEPIASRVGLGTPSPLTAMRETLTVLRELFQGRLVTFHGDYVHLDGVRFDAPDDDDAPSYDVPILMGAVGDRMLRLAGELADGVLLDFFVPPAYTEAARLRLAEGARRGGRDESGLRHTQLVVCSVDDADPAAAIEECRVVLARYLAQQPHVGAASGADPELVDRLRRTVGWPATTAQLVDAAKLVSTDLVRSVAACGSSDDALEMLQQYRDAGCGEPIIVPFGDRRATVETIIKRRAELR